MRHLLSYTVYEDRAVLGDDARSTLDSVGADGLELLTSYDVPDPWYRWVTESVHLPYATDWMAAWEGRPYDMDDDYSRFYMFGRSREDVVVNVTRAIECASVLDPAYGVFHAGDGELDGRMVKIMPVNRIATKADLKELTVNLPYKTYEKRKQESPNEPVEKITIVCMGHEPDLKGALEQELIDYKIDVQIVDILRDKTDLQLKREAEAEIVREGDKLVIRSFYPMNLMQKLSLQTDCVEDWRQLTDSVMIDWNYDGVVMQPAVIDIPEKNQLVKGVYDIPENAGTIKVKITDLLSESLETEVR